MVHEAARARNLPSLRLLPSHAVHAPPVHRAPPRRARRAARRAGDAADASHARHPPRAARGAASPRSPWPSRSSARRRRRAAEKPAGPAPASELLRAARDALVPLPERVKAGDYEAVRVVLVSEQLKPLGRASSREPITLIADALDDGFEALELREDISGHLLQADTMLYDNGFKDNGGGGGSKRRSSRSRWPSSRRRQGRRQGARPPRCAAEFCAVCARACFRLSFANTRVLLRVVRAAALHLLAELAHRFHPEAVVAPLGRLERPARPRAVAGRAAAAAVDALPRCGDARHRGASAVPPPRRAPPRRRRRSAMSDGHVHERVGRGSGPHASSGRRRQTDATSRVHRPTISVTCCGASRASRSGAGAASPSRPRLRGRGAAGRRSAGVAGKEENGALDRVAHVGVGGGRVVVGAVEDDGRAPPAPER